MSPKHGLLAWIAVSACSAPPKLAPDAEPDSAPPRCLPVNQETAIEEGSLLSLKLTCSSPFDLQSEEIALSGLPTGATFDQLTKTLTWTPSLEQAARYELTATIPSTRESVTFTIDVADAFDHPQNVPIADPAKYPFEFGMPVIFLPAIDSLEYGPAEVRYRGREYQTIARIRGASSTAYPQKSYTIDFSLDKLSDERFGLVNKKKIVLLSTFDDNTYMRMRLAWEYWNRLEPTAPVVNFPVVVYRDNQFNGVYLLAEHVDEEVFANHGVTEQGHLFKAINHDANFKATRANGQPKTTLGVGYEKQNGEPRTDFSTMEELVSFVINASDAEFDAQIGQKMSFTDYSAWFAMVVLSRADDSAGKNSYHIHTPGELWHVIPWDFNASFGQSWETSRVAPAYSDYRWANRLFERLLASQLWGPLLRKRVTDAMAGPLSLQTIGDLWDRWDRENRPGHLRTQRKWGADYLSFPRWAGRSDFTDHAGEVDYVKTWISEHYQKVIPGLSQ